MDLSRRQLLALSAASISSVAGCQGLVNPTTSDVPSSSDPVSSNPEPTESSEGGVGERLGLAYATGGASFSSDEEVYSGWVHIVSHGESADLTFDARFCGVSEDVKPTLTRSLPYEYVLDFTTESNASIKTASTTSDEELACGPGSRITGGANVPKDWKTLTVAVNGTQIQTVERTGTTAKLRPLPDPIRF